MSGNKRVQRLNSLLKEVLSDVIRKEVRDPRLHPLFSITEVEISKDLQHAKVFVSVIGTDKERKDTLAALESAAGFIAIAASKEVVMRYFPCLNFRLDTSVDQQMRIDNLLNKLQEEKRNRSVEDEK